jgi:phytoene synthase
MHVGAFGITREHLLQILEGMQMDLQQTRYLDYPSLQRYCHLVAGVVGEISAGIFGASAEATLAYARSLGQSLQLVNILRDVGEDARRGRVYLPISDLQRFDVKVADLLNGRYVEGFEALMRFEAQRARSLYRDALALLPQADRRAQRPGLIMGAIYLSLLDELERTGFRVLHQRIALTPLRKLWIAWRTWVFGPPARLQRA